MGKYDFGGGNISNMLVAKMMQDMFKSPQEKKIEDLQMQKMEADISAITSPLSQYESVFNRKWANLGADIEDKEQVNKLKTINKNFYTNISKGKKPEVVLDIKDAYEFNQAKIDNQIKLIDDWDKYKGTITSLYGELETALLHNQKTLDQLGGVYAEGFENWEEIAINGTSEQKKKFRKNVLPFMKDNGNKISLIMQKIVQSERNLSKYDKFSDYGYTYRDMKTLREFGSNLGQELKTNTFITDAEARGLQNMWINKDPLEYLSIKERQKKDATSSINLLRAKSNQLTKDEKKIQTTLNLLKESGRTEDVESGFTYDALAKQKIAIRKELEENRLKIIQTGELGATIGEGGIFGDITPVSGIKTDTLGLSEEQLKEITPPSPDKNNKKRYEGYAKEYGISIDDVYGHAEDFKELGQKYQGTFLNYLQDLKDDNALDDLEKPDKFSYDTDKILSDYSNIYKYNVNASDEGQAFKSKHSLKGKSMALLNQIEQVKKSTYTKGKQEKIASLRTKLEASLEKDVKDRYNKIHNKATSKMNAYANSKSSVSSEVVAMLKKAIPDIDAQVEAWKKAKKQTKSKIKFTLFLSNEGKDIDYEHFKELL